MLGRHVGAMHHVAPEKSISHFWESLPGPSPSVVVIEYVRFSVTFNANACTMASAAWACQEDPSQPCMR